MDFEINLIGDRYYLDLKLKDEESTMVIHVSIFNHDHFVCLKRTGTQWHDLQTNPFDFKFRGIFLC